MTNITPFRAEKPILMKHPLNGGDALMFTITPRPPRAWWRAMRHNTQAHPALRRPWDQEQESRIAVECPPLAQLSEVLDAIDLCVVEATRECERQSELEADSADARNAENVKRARYLIDLQHEIDERYAIR